MAQGLAYYPPSVKDAPRRLRRPGTGQIVGVGFALGFAMTVLGLGQAVLLIDPKRLVVVFNDNGWSISENVGWLTRWRNRIMLDPKYQRFAGVSQQLLAHFPGGAKAWEVARKIKTSVEGLILPNTIWEELGFHYIGPVDGRTKRHGAPGGWPRVPRWIVAALLHRRVDLLELLRSVPGQHDDLGLGALALGHHHPRGIGVLRRRHEIRGVIAVLAAELELAQCFRGLEVVQRLEAFRFRVRHHDHVPVHRRLHRTLRGRGIGRERAEGEE